MRRGATKRPSLPHDGGMEQTTLAVQRPRIVKLRYECQECGAEISVKPEHAQLETTHCPNCRCHWGVETFSVYQAARHWNSALSSAKFGVTLELEESTAARG